MLLRAAQSCYSAPKKSAPWGGDELRLGRSARRTTSGAHSRTCRAVAIGHQPPALR